MLERNVGPSPGLALEGQIHLRPTGRIGGGVVAFGGFGDGISFGGLALALRIGRIR